MAGSNIARQKNGVIYVSVNPALASANVLIAAAAADVKIRIVSLVINCTGGANTIQFKSSTTANFPLLSFGANGGLVMECNLNGWFETVKNEALNCTLTNASAVGMQIGYVHSTV